MPRQALLIDGEKFNSDYFKYDGDYCVLGIAASSENDDSIVLGAQFMTHYYAVVDHESQSFGFALNLGSRGYITDGFVSDKYILKVFVSVLGVLIFTILAAFTMAKCR